MRGEESNPKKLWAERDSCTPCSPKNLIMAEYIKSHSPAGWTQNHDMSEVGRDVQSRAFLKTLLRRLRLHSKVLSISKDGDLTASPQLDHSHSNLLFSTVLDQFLTLPQGPTASHCTTLSYLPHQDHCESLKFLSEQSRHYSHWHEYARRGRTLPLSYSPSLKQSHQLSLCYYLVISHFLCTGYFWFLCIPILYYSQAFCLKNFGAGCLHWQLHQTTVQIKMPHSQDCPQSFNARHFMKNHITKQQLISYLLMGIVVSF